MITVNLRAAGSWVAVDSRATASSITQWARCCLGWARGFIINIGDVAGNADRRVRIAGP